MAFSMNLVTLTGLIFVSLCGGVVVKPHLAPILDEVRPVPPIDESTVPRYSYVYDVHDALTGDFKNHHETREGGLVRGGYSFIESDGSRRIVDYVADPINGFNAVVRKEPGAAHPTDPAAVPPKAHLHPHPVAPTVLPTLPPPFGHHLRPIPAVTPASHPFLPISPPHLKLPALNYPVHPYEIYEPHLPNELFHGVAPRKYVPIGRYGLALTNAAFPIIQPH